MTDSSSQSDDTSGCCGTTTTRTSRGRSTTNSRRRKSQLNAKERNLRRLESNERERMRMHSLNDAFQVYNISLQHNFIHFTATHNASVVIIPFLLVQSHHLRIYFKII